MKSDQCMTFVGQLQMLCTRDSKKLEITVIKINLLNRSSWPLKMVQKHLKELLWLPVCFWAEFEVLLLTFRILKGLGLDDLND